MASEGVGGVKYVQQDWQGSVRAVTNSNGFVVARTDHQAFRDDVGYGVGQRSIEQGYSVGKVARQGYGLTERDDATGQDHTWFRKKGNKAGRWTSPDPYNGSMNLGDPQSFNRYSYVNNQPTNFVDPSGLNMSAGGYSWSCYITWTSNADGSDFKITSVSCQVWANGGGGGGIGPSTSPSKIDKDCLHKQLAVPLANATTRIEAAKKAAQEKRDSIISMATAQDAVILLFAAAGVGAAAWFDEAPPVGALIGAGIGAIGATGWTAYQATNDWNSTYTDVNKAMDLENAIFTNSAQQAYADCIK